MLQDSDIEPPHPRVDGDGNPPRGDLESDVSLPQANNRDPSVESISSTSPASPAPVSESRVPAEGPAHAVRQQRTGALQKAVSLGLTPMIPPVEHHARPTQIPGMRHSTSALQGHDVDEAEALQEAIRRSLGLTPMDPREHANSAEALLSMPSSSP